MDVVRMGWRWEKREEEKDGGRREKRREMAEASPFMLAINLPEGCDHTDRRSSCV